MMITRKTSVAAVAVMAMTTFGAAAMTPKVTPLSKEKHINTSLMSAKVADTIRKTCPDISARMLVALGKAHALKSYALDRGYKEPQVRAFLKDPTEKARVKAMAADYLKSHGAVVGNVESYCVVGRDEIAKKSLIGQMLRAK